MVRHLLFRVIPFLLLLLLLLPAVAYIASPWWAPAACRWAAGRFWDADLAVATATVNPFTLRMEGAGGVFTVTSPSGIGASGQISRFRLEADLIPLLRRRVEDLSLELASLTVTVPEGKGMLPLSGPATAPSGHPRRARADSVTQAAGGDAGSWLVGHLQVHVQRGILRYSEKGRRGTVSMDINFQGSYREVQDMRRLGDELLQDLFSKAAYGILTERLFR